MFKFSRERLSEGWKVEVCYTSSYVHMFTCLSHLLIFSSSHLHIFTSSHLLSLSLLARSLALSLSLSCPPWRSLSFFFLSLLRQKLKQNCDFTSSSAATLSHEMVRVSKTDVKLRFYSAATLSHEMRFECEKLMQNCDFTSSAATLSHESRSR